MEFRRKWLMFFSLVIILSMALASCTLRAQEVVKTVIVTEVVEVVAGPVVEVRVITATPAPKIDEKEEVAAGPIPANGLVPCQPLPEAAVTDLERGDLGDASDSNIISNVLKPTFVPNADLQQDGSVYRVGVFDDVTTLNFWGANGPNYTISNSYMLPQRLALYSLSDKYFTFIPEVAMDLPESLLLEGDFFVVEIPVREDVVWSDGEPLTAEDIAFTANAVLDLGLISGKFENWYDANYLDHIEVVDDYRVKIYYRTNPGLAHHEYGTLQAPILAEHYWAPIVADAMAPIEALGEHPSQEELLTAQTDAHYILFSHQVEGEPIAGGFALAKWEKGVFLEGVKNPDYLNTGLIVQQWANGAYKDSVGIEAGPAPEGNVETEYKVGPHVDSIVYTIYGSQEAAILAMQKGEVDYVLNSLGLQRGLSDKIKDDPNFTVIGNPTNNIRYLSFNNRRRPMNDCAFRQAVAVLIDKEFVTGTILQDVAFPLYTYVPEANTAWYFDDVPKLGQGLDREQRVNLAVAILEQAGFYWENDQKPAYSPDNLRVEGAGRLMMPDGTPVPPLKLLAPSPNYDPLRSTFAFWIKSWLDEMGIPVVTELAGIKVLTPLIFTEHDFDMYILGWSLDIFPDHLWLYFAEEQAVPNGNNAGGYINPEFETLSSQILTCTDVIGCKEIADQSQSMLSTESPYVMLYSTEIIEAFRSDSLEFPFVEALGGIQYHHLDGNFQPSVEIK